MKIYDLSELYTMPSHQLSIVVGSIAGIGHFNFAESMFSAMRLKEIIVNDLALGKEALTIHSEADATNIRIVESNGNPLHNIFCVGRPSYAEPRAICYLYIMLYQSKSAIN